MIEVVTARNALLYEDALRDMHSLRHRMLVERRGLNRLRKRDNLQSDRFDTADAIYLLLTEDDGTVRGTARLLPTTGPHVFADVSPELCDVKGVQRGSRILELTRAMVDEDNLDRAGVENARNSVMVGVFEFIVRAGYEKFTALMTTDMLYRYLVMGIDVKPLGLTVERGGGKQVAVIVSVDQNAQDALRLALDVFEPLIHYVGAPAGDPLALAPPRIPARPLEAAE